MLCTILYFKQELYNYEMNKIAENKHFAKLVFVTDNTNVGNRESKKCERESII